MSFNCSFAIISSATASSEFCTHRTTAAFQLLIRNYFLCNDDIEPVKEVVLFRVSIAHSQLFPLQLALSRGQVGLFDGFNCSFAIISSATAVRPMPNAASVS